MGTELEKLEMKLFTVVGVLLLAAVIFAIAVAFWAWIIMLVQGAIVGAGEWHMSYREAIPWGVAASLVAGILNRGSSN